MKYNIFTIIVFPIYSQDPFIYFPISNCKGLEHKSALYYARGTSGWSRYLTCESESHDGVITLQWRYDGRDSVSNHQPRDCLLNRLFRPRSKKTSKLRVTGLCAGNLPGTGEFPAQMASNAENVSIWWRHHEVEAFSTLMDFVRGIHRSPVNSPHKSQWRGAFMFSLICAWIHGSVNNLEAGYFRCHRAHDVTVTAMWWFSVMWAS